MKVAINFYQPIFDLIGESPIYFGEFFGLSAEDARQQYEHLLKEGFYDESDY